MEIGVNDMDEHFIGEDGFRRCKICGERLEREVEFPIKDGTGKDGTGKVTKKIVHCTCKCERTKREEMDRKRKFEEEMRRVEELRRLSLMDAKLRVADFSTYKVDSENEKAFKIANNYVNNFEKMFTENQGILFYGKVGTGKSYTAAAIANELINRKKSVIMTSFIKLLQDMGNFNSDDGQYINQLNSVRLLIIDDLGAERSTDFALEKVYNIVDSRYRCGKPIILTTNLDLNQMKNCEDIRYTRIYDRIFEMCYPVKMDGLSWRKKEAAGRFKAARTILEA